MQEQVQEILQFWFSDAVKARWYDATPAFDDELRERFGALVQAARAGDLDDWSTTPEGALALVILLDQMPRNMFRGTPDSFASDGQALERAQSAIAAGFDARVAPERRSFFYLPFMHSEDLATQQRCVELCEALGGADNVKYAKLHRDLIERFGRFPHRNEILGRDSRQEEVEYLASEGAFRG